MSTPLSKDLLQKMKAYWQAAKYLLVTQIYLNVPATQEASQALCNKLTRCDEYNIAMKKT